MATRRHIMKAGRSEHVDGRMIPAAINYPAIQHRRVH